MKDEIIRDITNPFRLKRENKKKRKEIDYTAIKDIRNFFKLKKENEPIKGRVTIDIRNLLDHE